MSQVIKQTPCITNFCDPTTRTEFYYSPVMLDGALQTPPTHLHTCNSPTTPLRWLVYEPAILFEKIAARYNWLIFLVKIEKN